MGASWAGLVLAWPPVSEWRRGPARALRRRGRRGGRGTKRRAVADPLARARPAVSRARPAALSLSLSRRLGVSHSRAPGGGAVLRTPCPRGLAPVASLRFGGAARPGSVDDLIRARRLQSGGGPGGRRPIPSVVGLQSRAGQGLARPRPARCGWRRHHAGDAIRRATPSGGQRPTALKPLAVPARGGYGASAGRWGGAAPSDRRQRDGGDGPSGTGGSFWTGCAVVIFCLFPAQYADACAGQQ